MDSFFSFIGYCVFILIAMALLVFAVRFIYQIACAARTVNKTLPAILDALQEQNTLLKKNDKTPNDDMSK